MKSGCVSDFGKSICVVKNNLQLGLLFVALTAVKTVRIVGCFLTNFRRVSLCLTNWG
jgi:hypothetical protein